MVIIIWLLVAILLSILVSPTLGWTVVAIWLGGLVVILLIGIIRAW